MRKAELFIAAKHRLAESAIWHAATGCIYWIDLLDPMLCSYHFGTGTTRSRSLPVEPPLGAIAVTEDPGTLAITHGYGVFLLDIGTLTMRPWCDPERGRDAIIYNDAKVDHYGRLWAGTSHSREKEPRGALWCIDANRNWALADAGFAIANGPAFSPDGETLYFNDSVGRTTLAYDIGPGDMIARNRRVLIAHAPDEGLPDGIVTDAEGCLWIAHWGGARVSRYRPDGRKIGHWPLPAPHVTTMCFAGPNFATLFITTARDGLLADQIEEFPLSGSLFRLETNTLGTPEPRMRLR
jgi:sugar lactone lactonase YvrE